MNGILRGPAHPEQFRQQIGRYGDRHYVDNLPGDPIHVPDSPRRVLPSISVIKQAYPKFLTDWAAQAAATYAVEHSAAWMLLKNDEAIDLIAKAAIRARDRAAKRGSDVHALIEQLSLGIEPDYLMIDDAIKPYVPCVQQLVKDLRLVPLVLESVVFNHEVGYGGTFDFIGETVHGIGLLDWKTRAKTTRYDEEAAQVAAYAGGEYMIVESPLGGAMRAPLPDLDYLGVVVISPTGYQVHEVNEVDAWDLWCRLADFWTIKNNGKFYEGTLATPFGMPVAEKQNLIDRVRALSEPARKYLAARWPEGLPTLKQDVTDYDLLRIEKMVSDVETKDSAAFNYPPPVDEGEVLDILTFREIDKMYKTLDWHIRQAVDFWLDAAQPAVRMGNFTRTVRRFEILRMMIYLAELCDGDTGRMGEAYNMVGLGRITKEEACELANDYRQQIEQKAQAQA
jgi:hypothetical protein